MKKVILIGILFVLLLTSCRSEPKVVEKVVEKIVYVEVTPTPTPVPTEIPDCTDANRYHAVDETDFDESRIQVTSSCEDEYKSFSKVAESRYYQVFRSNFKLDKYWSVYYVEQVRRVDGWPQKTGEAIFPKADSNPSVRVEGQYLLLSNNTFAIDVEWTDLANRVLFITRFENGSVVATNELIAPLNAEQSTKPEQKNYHPQDNSPKCLLWRALGGDMFPGTADYEQCHSR